MAATRERRVALEYRFDRLGVQKLAQAYRALVPEGISLGENFECLMKGGPREAGSDLRARIVGTPKRRADDR